MFTLAMYILAVMLFFLGLGLAFFGNLFIGIIALLICAGVFFYGKEETNNQRNE